MHKSSRHFVCLSLAHLRCSPMYIYMCTFSMPYTRTKAVFQKLRFVCGQMSRALILRHALFCQAIPGTQTGRQHGPNCAIMPMARGRWTTWPWLPQFMTVCGFFVLLPDISMYQCKCTVISILLWAFICHISFSLPHTRTKA